MAEKLLSIEEAAAHLGLKPEDVRQLVDRRQISAIRDTTGLKFRLEELDRTWIGINAYPRSVSSSVPLGGLYRRVWAVRPCLTNSLASFPLPFLTR